MALVQTSGKLQYTGTATSRTENAASNFTVGNLVVVGISYYEDGTGKPTAVSIAGTAATEVSPAKASFHSVAAIWYAIVANASRTDVVLTIPSGSHSYTLAIEEWSDIENAAADKTGTQADTYGTSTSASTGALSQNDELVIFQTAIAPGSNQTIGTPTNYTLEVKEETDGTYPLGGMFYRVVTAGGTETPSSSNSTGAYTNGAIAAFKIAAAPLEQVRFRWGSDDGSESAHGWAASENANLTATNNQTKLLRVQVQATGDPPSQTYPLRVQKNGAGGYVAVPVGASTSPTLTFGAAGTIAYSASGGTTVAPTYPSGITTNSALVLIVGQKPSSANGGTCTTPAGWTLQAEISGANDGDTGGYTTTLGVDTGNTNLYVYTKDTVTGSETGTLSVTVGTNNVCWANIYRVQSSDTCTWSYAAATGKDTSAGNVSIATGSIAIAAGDYIIGAMVIPTDVTTPSQFSAEALSQSGTTFGTVTEIQEPDSGTGNDIGGFLVEAPVSSGSGSGAVTMTATAGGTTTNVRGPGAVIRLRATSVNNECYIATSGNITAGGEATTGRLTAGTGSFVTGRRWDDENGSDSIDITTNNYTEFEWAVALSSAPATNDYFDFRVYKGTSALTTYTVTPRWTVGSGVSASSPMSMFGQRMPMTILAQ